MQREETKNMLRLASLACRQVSQEERLQQPAAWKPALRCRGRRSTLKSHVRSTGSIWACITIVLRPKIILPLWCRARTSRPPASCPASPPCPAGSSQSRPLCQTSNTLGRGDGWLPGSSQLGQSHRSTSELPRHGCTFLPQYPLGSKGTNVSLSFHTKCSQKQAHMTILLSCFILACPSFAVFSSLSTQECFGTKKIDSIRLHLTT